MSSQRLHALLMGFAMVGAMSLPTHAQLLVGSNGSRSALAPTALSKRTAKASRVLSTTKLRTDYVTSPNDYFVLQLASSPSALTQATIAKYATLLHYIPDGFYLYRATKASKAIAEIRSATLGQVEIVSEGNLPAVFKLESRLYTALQMGILPEEATTNGIGVYTHQDSDLSALYRTLDRWKIAYRVVGRTAVLTAPTLLQVEQVAALPYVGSVSIEETPVELYLHSQELMQTNGINIVNYDRRGPIGKGTYFVNWETYGGEPEYSINTYGRNIEGYTDTRINSHGTNCGLIVSGANNVDEYRTSGMAPGTHNLSGYLVDQTRHHHWAVAEQMQAGMTPLVSNHSVGWNSGVHHYDGNAQRVDQDIHRTNAYMCVYPTGNYAYGNHYWGPYTQNITPNVADYGNITGTIKTNKNGLAVHSTLFPGTDVTWANFGPTYDGRMKPEICAQGIGGTSYASPGVAGMMAVLYEQWHTTHPSEPMRADACKAVMLNTAMDVRTYVNRIEAGFGLDYRTGYGQIAPLFAVNSIKDLRVKYDESVSTNETKDFTINVPAGQTELRVMLLWNDPAAVSGAATALINDLDLEVIAPDNQTYLPWTLDPAPTKVTLPAERKVNRRDNHERVVITAANKNTPLPAGSYTIRVKGHHVPQGPQNYVLTWQWRPREIVMTSIPEGFRLQPKQVVTITWDMQLAESEEQQATNWRKGAMTPTVEYRTSPSDSWKACTATLGFQYNAKGDDGGVYGYQRGKNFLSWQVPTDLPATAQLQFRVKADDLEAISNNAHVNVGMGRPQLLRLSPQEVKLKWEAVSGATTGKYIIYALYDKYMTAVDSVDAPTTEKTITPPTGTQWSDKHLFAIGYKTAQGSVGQRSYPVGLDHFNKLVSHEADRWENEYTLCYGDTLNLGSGQLEGNVTWYRDGQALPNTERVLKLTNELLGRYKYTITYGGQVVYTSGETMVTKPSIALADTSRWGFGKWNAYVFKRQNATNSAPLLTNNDGYYGTFTVNPLQFDSNEMLFPWQHGEIHQSPGYIGCPTPSKGQSEKFVIVMKRTGFVPGTYTFTMKRVAGIAEIIVRNAQGTLLQQRTVSEAYNEAFPAVRLDANSTVEIRWSGVHFNFAATAMLSGAGYSPAKVSSNLDYWINPATLNTADDLSVRYITSAKPAMDPLAADGSDAPATLVANGSNYNATLRFDGTGGYTGVTPRNAAIANTTDFIVAHVDAETPAKTRLLTFGLHNESTDITSDSTYAVMLNGGKVFSTTRGGIQAANGNYSSGRLALLTIRQGQNKQPEILYNGAKVKAVGSTAITSNLVLPRMAIGTDFDSTTNNYLKGDLSEIIHYTGSLNTQQENSVRTYLAIKHGLTLDHDYVDGNKVLYPVNSYAHQIVGLGRSVLSRLDQRQSKGYLNATVPSTTVLALGDLAASNAENTSKLADGKYYIMGSNIAYKAATYRGTQMVANPIFRLITTKKPTEAYDELSLYIPKADLQRGDYKPVLLVDTLTARLNSIGTASQKKLFEDYDDTYMRVRFTPLNDSCFVRIAWDVSTGVASALTEGESVVWDAETETLRVDLPTAEAIELYDAAGRLALRDTGVGARHIATASLPAAVYILKVQRSNGTTYSDKLAIFR